MCECVSVSVRECVCVCVCVCVTNMYVFNIIPVHASRCKVQYIYTGMYIELIPVQIIFQLAMRSQCTW